MTLIRKYAPLNGQIFWPIPGVILCGGCVEFLWLRRSSGSLSGSHQASPGLSRGGKRGAGQHPGGNEKGQSTESPLTLLPLTPSLRIIDTNTTIQLGRPSKEATSACFKYLQADVWKCKNAAGTIDSPDGADGRELLPSVRQFEHFLSQYDTWNRVTPLWLKTAFIN